jgi:2-keto-3-deoxy-L-rhamnonate aldolase RhmA
METGASGVMAAQIRTVDQVRQIVAWAKYPPIGVRGLFQSNYEAGYTTRNVPELIEEANRNRWLGVIAKVVGNTAEHPFPSLWHSSARLMSSQR